MWDVTVWYIFAPSYSRHAAGKPGSVANLAEAAKRLLYSELAVAHHFVPIRIDSLGILGDSARCFFKELGFRTRTLTGDPQSYLKLCQLISVTIQRFYCPSIISSSRHAMDSLLD